MLSSPHLKIAIVGAGWSGLAAAVTATDGGHRVTVFEMAAQPGGRARQIAKASPLEQAPDNGQHLLIGAYRETLRLMAHVGVKVQDVFHRTPLHLVDAQGQGLLLPLGSPTLSFLRGVWAHPHWSRRQRMSLLLRAVYWRGQGFRCASSLTVDQLTRDLPAVIREELIEPLCVAALNTPSHEACAQVFLRVLKDAMLSGPGSADLLFPRTPLSDLWPAPAMQWLQHRGASLRLKHRVSELQRMDGQWQVDGEPFDAVILACTPTEAARLTRKIAPWWAEQASRIEYEPIATIYTLSPGSRLPTPMVQLTSDEHTRPAQFVLDHSHWGPSQGMLAFVVSGARGWSERGHAALQDATLRQAHEALGPWLRAPLRCLHTLIDKRATFRCTPGLLRPSAHIASGLHAAGDYIEGPYPATLEGAMRAGIRAAQQLVLHQLTSLG